VKATDWFVEPTASHGNLVNIFRLVREKMSLTLADVDVGIGHWFCLTKGLLDDCVRVSCFKWTWLSSLSPRPMANFRTASVSRRPEIDRTVHLQQMFRMWENVNDFHPTLQTIVQHWPFKRLVTDFSRSKCFRFRFRRWKSSNGRKEMRRHGSMNCKYRTYWWITLYFG
jgi:hypothetical protein